MKKAPKKKFLNQEEAAAMLREIFETDFESMQFLIEFIVDHTNLRAILTSEILRLRSYGTWQELTVLEPV